MLAAVKVLRTNEPVLEVKGAVPQELMDFLQSHYGESLQVFESDEALINPKDSAWYRETKGSMKPGVYLAIYRENAGLTQTQLGEKLGKTRFRVSEMERGVRGISKETAKQLAKIFKVPIERFL